MGDTSTKPDNEAAAGWAAYTVASAIRQLAEVVREGLEAIAEALREQPPAPK